MSHRQTIVIAGFAALGTAVGVITQYFWLHDARIETNWTLPSPGNFNLPGWYHAAFLVLASGVLTGAAAAAFFGIRQWQDHRQPDLLRSWQFAVAVSSIPVFTILLGVDARDGAWLGTWARRSLHSRASSSLCSPLHGRRQEAPLQRSEF